MRETKYRMFHKGQMYEVEMLDFNQKIAYMKNYKSYTSSYFNLDEIELNQYIGIKDKNEKEIYERDIVKVTEKDNIAKRKVVQLKPIIGEVYWLPENLTYVLIPVNKEYTFNNLVDYLIEYDLEVIGNVYENKELLEV